MLTRLPTLPFRFASILFAYLMTLTISLSQAQVNFTNPTHLTRQQGLSHNRVLCMEQDDDGFMWFGTYEGLSRYDGSHVKVFKHKPGDSTSLSSNNIRSLLYDQETSQLWIGTNKGLNVMDLRTEICKAYFHDPEDPNSIADNEIGRSIFKDRQGVLWIGLARNGFLKYDNITDKFIRFSYPHSYSDVGEKTERINYYVRIEQDLLNDSILWIVTGSGLLKFDKYEESYARYYTEMGDEKLNINTNGTYSMYLHDDGQVFLGTWSGMLNIFDPVSESFRQIVPTFNTERFPRGKGVVYDMMKKSDHELWVTTRQGVSVYDFEKDAITSELLNDVENDLIYWASFRDKNNRIWGRSATGVRIFDPLNQQFQHFSSLKPDDPQFAPMGIVEGPSEDLLYVNVAGGQGLYLLNRKNGNWTLIPPPASFFKRFNLYTGRDLLYLNDGRLLVVEQKMLFTLSEDRRSLVPFPLQPQNTHAKMMQALQDQQGRIWIASIDGGLYRIDLEANTTTIFWDELIGDLQKGESVSAKNIFEDNQQNIWINVRGGMTVYNSHLDSFFIFRHHPEVNNVFRYTTDFVEDHQGRIIIGGGKTEGIGIADPAYPEKGIISKLDFSGNPTLQTQGIYLDNSGNLWLEEDYLMKIDLPSLAIQRFDGKDGLAYLGNDSKSIPINTMNVLPSGEMVICYGQGLGISIFHPDSLRSNLEVPTPYIASFRVFDKEIDIGKGIGNRQEITLPFAENFFSFEFSAICFTQADENRFKYKLEGLDPDWVFPGPERKYASYSQVLEGDYTLRVMAANNEGLWNEKEFRLGIKILPPWFRSWWAYTLYFLFIATGAVVVYRFLRRRWALKMELEIERRELLRLQELDNTKTRLYTNITHEFRTPLTVISGMADQLQEDPKRWLSEAVNLIKRNSNSLLSLVNQMLDLRKLESGNMKVNLIQGDVIIYLKYLTESVHSLLEEKDITLSFQSNTKNLVLDYDPEKLQQIISNLLSNAIKFTPEGGNIQLKVNSQEPVSKQFVIVVSDSGVGIPNEKLPFIFDRFYQADNSDTRAGEGTGIGLALTKELVKLLGGEISVKSRVGMGTEFSISFPITRKASIAGIQSLTPISNSHPVFANAGKTLLKNNELPLLLIIEDNADLVHYLKACLEKDYQLEVAKNGREGVEKAIDIIPDLVISDVMMPEKDGFEVCEILKTDNRTSHIPVILLTAKADVESKLQGLESGADAYLPKPFYKKELFVRTRKLLELRQMLQAHYFQIASDPASNPSNTLATTEKESAFLLNVKMIIENHLSDAHFEVSILCKELGMSRSQLHRKLTALTGKSPIRLVRNVRLAKARSLLQETNLTVAEVAYDTGFSDPNYFSRVFSKEFGETPTTYKEKHVSH